MAQYRAHLARGLAIYARPSAAGNVCFNTPVMPELFFRAMSTAGLPKGVNLPNKNRSPSPTQTAAKI